MVLSLLLCQAVAKGTAPNGMFNREELIRQRRVEREQKNRTRQEEEFLQTQQEMNREKLRNTRIRLSIDPSKTWEDLKREEEVKRKDRIEKRKEELLQSSRYSEGLSKSVEKWKTFKSRESESLVATAAATTDPSSRRGSGSHVSPEEVHFTLSLLHPLTCGRLWRISNANKRDGNRR
jgi:type II secretory pathway pseudopilin PulG